MRKVHCVRYLIRSVATSAPWLFCCVLYTVLGTVRPPGFNVEFRKSFLGFQALRIRTSLPHGYISSP